TTIHKLVSYYIRTTYDVYTLSLHDALPIFLPAKDHFYPCNKFPHTKRLGKIIICSRFKPQYFVDLFRPRRQDKDRRMPVCLPYADRKSTRLNSSHVKISYAVFFLTK